MNLTLSVLILGISLFCGAASLSAHVRTDYDHRANFATYKTYSWLIVQAGDSLRNDRLQQGVDAQLAGRTSSSLGRGRKGELSRPEA